MAAALSSKRLNHQLNRCLLHPSNSISNSTSRDKPNSPYHCLSPRAKRLNLPSKSTSRDKPSSHYHCLSPLSKRLEY
ncbi:hypothetical protein NL676_011061 [Syzygium grande]|nr:hypothetical protein NL676_011061 [Syzygium grande]